MQKICFIVNYNLYESKRHFTVKLAEAFERKGVKTKIIDVDENSLSAELIQDLKAFEPDLTASFNTLLPVSEGRFLCDFLQIPHWSILVDPLFYSLQYTRSPYSWISCVDRSDVAYLQGMGFERGFFFPHGVERDLEPGDEKRIYEVVFFGTCYDYESLRASWQQRQPQEISKVLDEAIELFSSDIRLSLADALAKAWSNSKLDPVKADFPALFYYLDNYTRGKDRVELIRAIKDVPVHVYGDLSRDNVAAILGWRQYLKNQKNVTIHPSVPYGDALQILKQSKFCLNSMPFFKNGSHERVLIGLAAGAVPITTENLYFQEEFTPGKEVIFYPMNQYASVNEPLHRLLADETARQAAAAAGGKKVLANDTWDKRTEIISDLFQ